MAILPLLRKTVSAWDAHEAPRFGAALAFYTILSMAPLVILVTAIVALIVGHSTAQDQLLDQVESIVGREGSETVKVLIDHAQKPATGTFASVVGMITLLFGASGVFAELRSALNRIWDVEPEGESVWEIIKHRFFSVGMVVAVGFLLLVSLVVSAVLAAFGKFFVEWLPMPEVVLNLFNLGVSLVGTAVLFALIFRYVPKKTIAWKDIWVGATLTAFLFTIGKFLIGLYLGKVAVGSAYGAAGSLVVVIVWVYYSAMIFLFGAECTHMLVTMQRGRRPG